MEAILAMVWADMGEPLMVMVGRRGPWSAVGGQKKERNDYLEKLFLGLTVCPAGDNFIAKTACTPFRIDSLIFYHAIFPI